MIKTLSACLAVLLFSLNIYSQKVQINTLIIKCTEALDKADDLNELGWKQAKKCILENDLGEAKGKAFEIMKLAEQAKGQAELAEKKADEAEKMARDLNCFSAAGEADDAEDYCRHTANYTYEMYIYAKKASNETDLTYLRNYIGKVIAYAEDAYESVKNGKLELEDAIKDLELCK